MLLDISTVKPCDVTKRVPKCNWRIIVQLNFSDFYDTKNGMIEPTCEKFYRWKSDGIPSKFIHCDDAGENKKLQQRTDSDAWKLNLTFEYTGRDTPQRNHLTELGFSVIANRGRAMMAHANVPDILRLKLWREAFWTATILDGLVPITLEGVAASRYIHWSGSNPDFAYHLRVWGEAGTVKLRIPTTPKVEDRGKQCVMVGYAVNHPGNTYRMWDPSTERVHETRDVIWLKRMYFLAHSVSPNVVVTPVVDLPALMPSPALPVPPVDPTRPVIPPAVAVPPVIGNPVVQAGEGVVSGGTSTVEHSIKPEVEVAVEEEQVIDADTISALGQESAAGDTEDERDWHVSPTVCRSGRTKRVPQRLIEEIRTAPSTARPVNTTTTAYYRTTVKTKTKRTTVLQYWSTA